MTMKRISAVKLVMKNLQHHEMDHDASKMRIKIDKDLNLSGEDKQLILKFCKMCFSVMELDEDYTCFLSSDRRRSKIITTAICNLGDSNIKIYCQNRALSDILRSIAHEMFHLKQNEMGLIPRKLKKHYLEPVEWHANVVSGSLLSYFASKVGKDKVYR